MHTWTWVLVILTSAGLLLAVAGAIPAMRGLARLRARLDALSNSRLMRSIDGLQTESARFEALAGRTAPLLARAQAAVADIGQNAKELNQGPAREAMAQAGRDIHELAADLR